MPEQKTKISLSIKRKVKPPLVKSHFYVQRQKMIRHNTNEHLETSSNGEDLNNFDSNESLPWKSNEMIGSVTSTD